MFVVKKFPYEKLSFLSERQLAEHNLLYNGYINKMNEIKAKMENIDLTTANPTLSDLRSLKRAETFALNGVKLHEGYFDNMKANSKISADMLNLINKNFGSYERFKEEFMATALSVRGWTVLAYDLDYKDLRLLGSDAHDNGAVWSCIPLLILDVYEHAYFIDYGASRKKYVEAFIENIDWESVSMLLAKHGVK